MVGYALDALREAYFGEQADRLILIDYESLVRRPKETVTEIYKFIGEPLYDHDYENVSYSASEFDQLLGTPNLHTVSQKVQFTPRKSVLPPDLFRRFENDAFWMNPDANIHKVKQVIYKF